MKNLTKEKTREITRNFFKQYNIESKEKADELADAVFDMLEAVEQSVHPIGCTCAHKKDGSIMVYSKSCPDPSHAANASRWAYAGP